MRRVVARASSCLAVLLCSVTPAPAQTATQPGAPPATGGVSSLWLVAGGSFSTVRGDCQTCEEDYPYRHAGSVLADVGYRVNSRMDVAAELFWVPVDTESGRVKTTHLDAVAQFRPWATRGFFLKGGAGMALVHNWVEVFSPEPINSKALSVVLGGGWAFRPTARLGLELFATHHAAALGDLDTATGQVPDVMSNFWSLGAGLVIR